ncbi:hypothetical protein TNCV_3162981 [Trichonephila clavipes]|nr:hypothetical protein TNCV_3162981 [Trichonephila clavipes]
MSDPPIRTLFLRQAHPHQATSTISIWDGGTLRVPFPSDIQRHHRSYTLAHRTRADSFWKESTSDPKCFVIHSSEDQLASFKNVVVIHSVFSSVIIENQ